MSPSEPPIVLASPDLRPSTLSVARSLVQAGLLRQFVTTLAVSPPSERGWWERLAWRCLGRSQRLLGTRQVPEWLSGYVERYPVRELVRVATNRLGCGAVTCDRIWQWAEAGFDRQVARRWAGRTPCIYGCEHASVETFRRQKAAGGLTILWQVIAHPRVMGRLLREETDQFPTTATAYTRHVQQTAERVDARKEEQFALADLIVANSAFVRQTFIEAGIPAEKVVVVPTACPPVCPATEPERTKSGKLIFLSAGTQTVRKGTHLLLEAWRRLRPPAGAELWLMGRMELPEKLLSDLPANVVVRPPVPRAELHELFGQVAVFVLPTLCEGRAHVLLEAIAHGVPVVTTGHAGCDDVIQPGRNGWIVPIRDTEALAERLQWCLEHLDELAAMRAASRLIALGWQEADFNQLQAETVRRFLREQGVSVRASEILSPGAGVTC
jgi:glycosyltransferase involved in cell wall biosynthesis